MSIFRSRCSFCKNEQRVSGFKTHHFVFGHHRETEMLTHAAAAMEVCFSSNSFVYRRLLEVSPSNSSSAARNLRVAPRRLPQGTPCHLSIRWTRLGVHFAHLNNCGHGNNYSRRSLEKKSSPWMNAKKFLASVSRGEKLCCRAKNDLFGEGPEDEETGIQTTSWPILKRWDIPWDGKTTTLGMTAWLLSFLLTGLFVSVLAAQFGIGRRQYMSLDDQAVYILIHQLAQTIAGLSIINLAVTKYKPLPVGLFSFDLKSPFNLERGWLLWGAVGLVCSGAAVVAASYISTAVNGQVPSRDDTDALVQLLPIIGASPLSTASLIGVTGVLAPLLEETVFRGFLMTSLTKWMPTPLAVVFSAGAFAAAHLTPGEFPQLFALGIILGFSYSQTRNLACPMLIHCIWNSGVVILLTLLRLQGFDIKELL